MAKRPPKPLAPVALEATVTETPATVPAPVVVVAAVKTLRLPLGEARTHNKVFGFVSDDNVVAANIALTAKATNPKKVRVYGYDNLSDGGGVPKDKRVVLVPGFVGTPKGVATPQWEKLVAAPASTTVALKDLGITSRTIRRAYRAGAIRFAA